MTMVNLDEELHDNVRKMVEFDPVENPHIKNYIERAVREKLRIDKIRIEQAKKK